MKKIIAIAIVTLSLSLTVTSCKKTASPSPDTPAAPVSVVGPNITGTWNWTDLKDSLTTGASAGTCLTYTVGGGPSTITFNSSGTYTSDRNFSQIGNPNNLSVDNGNYTNTDSLIITSVVISTPTRSPVRAKLLSVTSTNLTLIYKTGTKYHTCYFTKQ